MVHYPDGKTETVFADGRRSITFSNGTVKTIFPDGRVLVRFFNGDTKETFPNKQVSEIIWMVVDIVMICTLYVKSRVFMIF